MPVRPRPKPKTNPYKKRATRQLARKGVNYNARPKDRRPRVDP